MAGGLVEHVPASGRYRLGIRLVQLGNLVLSRLDLRQSARPHLDALVESTGETATLSVPGERDAVTVDFVQSPSSVQGVARLGRPSIAHATATGKVMLAFGTTPLPPGQLRAYTSRTITDRSALAAELNRIRGRGYGYNLGEREDDLHAIAAPVWGSRDELAAPHGRPGPSVALQPEGDGRSRRDVARAHARRVIAARVDCARLAGSGDVNGQVS